MEEVRQLPYSIESEQYILASALINLKKLQLS